MADIILFKSIAELDAAENLNRFISFARDELSTFGCDLNFDSDIWNVTRAASLRCRNGLYHLHFTGYPSNPAAKNGIKMLEPFKAFAKSYVRYNYSLGSTKVNDGLIVVFRAIYQAMLEMGGVVSPDFLTIEHFQRASQILRRRYKSSYSTYRLLEQISIFLVDNRLVRMPVIWRSSEKKPFSSTKRVGEEFDARRNALLPSPDALNAIAEIFHSPMDASDIFVASICAILTSAPSRISEVLNLSCDCEVENVDSKNNKVYGLRWFPAKGGDALVKWVVPSMVDVARKAIANLKAQSAEARRLAKWYENNPGKIYLPENLEYLRSKQRIKFHEVSLIVFRDATRKIKPEQRGSKWCAIHGISSFWEGGSPEQGGSKTVAFADVEAAILSYLPRNFPVADVETGLHYSDALCLNLKNAMTANLGVYQCAFVFSDYGVFKARLGGTKHMKSIFEKHNFKNNFGGYLSVNSHQIRHYLNTIAQMGGLGQLDVAKWSGRVNVSQNSVYDHESDRDILAKVRSAIGDGGKMFGPLAAIPDRKIIDRKTFSALKVVTAHVTEFGYCIHDYSMLPCQVHRDCINCDEQVCIKGDVEKERALRQCQSETKTLLDKAKLAQGEGEFGASRWVEHQELTLSRLDQLCSILDDPEVPLGSIIQPKGVVPASRLEKPVGINKLMSERNQIS